MWPAAINIVQATALVALAEFVVAGPYTPPDCSKEPLASNGICDTTLSPSARAAALVEAMRPQDKVNNLVRSVRYYKCPPGDRVILIPLQQRNWRAASWSSSV